jgi:hypothetical protein
VATVEAEDPAKPHQQKENELSVYFSHFSSPHEGNILRYTA